MVPDLLRRYIEVPDAWSIMRTLKELFEVNQEIKLYRRSKELFHAELKDGGASSIHILIMIDQIWYLERHGIVIDERLGP